MENIRSYRYGSISTSFPLPVTFFLDNLKLKKLKDAKPCDIGHGYHNNEQENENFVPAFFTYSKMGWVAFMAIIGRTDPACF